MRALVNIWFTSSRNCSIVRYLDWMPLWICFIETGFLMIW